MPEKRKAKETKPTKYVVLEQLEITPELGGVKADTAQGEVWLEVGETTIKSGNERAIVKAVVGDRAGTFKAVSARAWKGAVKRSQQTIWQDEVIA